MQFGTSQADLGSSVTVAGGSGFSRFCARNGSCQVEGIWYIDTHSGDDLSTLIKRATVAAWEGTRAPSTQLLSRRVSDS